MYSDPQSRDLFLYLLQKASVPYWNMLGSWIYQGLISDPYGEFLVEEHHEQQKENLNEDVNDTYPLLTVLGKGFGPFMAF